MNRLAGTRSRAWPEDDGFTLVELLVVLAVIGLALSAMPMLVSAGRPGVLVKATARTLADEMRGLRATAIVGHHETSLVVDLSNHRYRTAPGGRIRQLPEAVSIDFRRPNPGMATEIHFYPDGSSNGGRIGLTAGRSRRWIAVDWLSGRISIDE